MQYKLLALDIDGTLLNTKKEITPRVRQAIRAAVDKGCFVLLATGRMYRAMYKINRSLGLTMPCMVFGGGQIVEDGKIIEFSAEPGRFTWESSSEPSLFDNGFQGLKDSFRIFGKRFTMGGTPGKDQRVYFVNLKEIIDNKFGSASPMPYHDPMYRNIYIRYFGQYTFRIQDPVRFYANLSGNVSDVYTKTQLMQQCDAEFVNALDTALAECADQGYVFSDLPKKQMEIAHYMNDALDDAWNERRGMVVEMVAIQKVTPDEEDARQRSRDR